MRQRVPFQSFYFLLFCCYNRASRYKHPGGRRRAGGELLAAAGGSGAPRRKRRASGNAAFVGGFSFRGTIRTVQPWVWCRRSSAESVPWRGEQVNGSGILSVPVLKVRRVRFDVSAGCVSYSPGAQDTISRRSTGFDGFSISRGPWFYEFIHAWVARGSMW